MGDLVRIAALLPPPVAFVLGGGGSYGAVQVGMLRALAETDVRPHLVVGTSVGSLNGVVVAVNPDQAPALLSAIWPQISRKNVFPVNVVSQALAARSNRPWLFDPGPLSDLLTANIPVASIEELSMPFVAVATDLDTGVRVDLDSGEIRTALLASSAIPGVFPWVERDGRRLVDGGLVANVPIGVAVERGAKSVVVLDCGLFGIDGRWARSLVSVIVQALTITARQQVITDLHVATEVPVVFLPTPTTIPSTLFDFTHTETLAAAAYDETRQLLAALALHREPLRPGVYGDPPVAVNAPSIAGLVRW